MSVSATSSRWMEIPMSIIRSQPESWRLYQAGEHRLSRLPDEEYDDPLGESSGAGVIFGNTGGVIEAACRTATSSIREESRQGGVSRTAHGGYPFSNGRLRRTEAEYRDCSRTGQCPEAIDEVRAGGRSTLSRSWLPRGCISGAVNYTHLKEEILKTHCRLVYGRRTQKDSQVA